MKRRKRHRWPCLACDKLSGHPRTACPYRPISMMFEQLNTEVANWAAAEKKIRSRRCDDPLCSAIHPPHRRRKPAPPSRRRRSSK
jgi:hypothetical protein